MLTAEIKTILKPKTGDVTALILVGNDLRSDDGVGPYLAQKIHPKDHYLIFDAGEKPENIFEDVIKAKPDKTVLIDAADFGGENGELKIIPLSQLSDIIFSTHIFPLKAIAEIIINNTNTKFHFLGIQPKNTHLGEKLSPEVKASADKIIKFINNQGNH